MSYDLQDANWTDKPFDVAVTSELANIDSESLQEQVKVRYKQDTKQRKMLATWVIFATSIWLAAVLVLMFLLGFGAISISDNVMDALLITTTFNVLGLAYIVLEGLFGRSKRIKKEA